MANLELSQNELNFWRTTHWLEYLQNSKFRVIFKDHSFFYKGKFIPLLQEVDQLFSPGFDDEKEVLQQIKRIAFENNIKRIQVNSDIKEYLDMSGYTCVLNLDKISLTKGHKSAIRKAEKHLTYQSVTDIKRFKNDYFRIAGKVTRPDEAFDILGQWIQQGIGTLLKAQHNGETAGYAYLIHWHNYGYYFMSAVEPQFKEYNVSHYLQSVAFDMLRQKGVQHYELGDQVYSSLHHQPSAKERNISLFKRGFGGEIIRKPVSEYFFDLAYMEKIYKERLQNYIKERANENTSVLPKA